MRPSNRRIQLAAVILGLAGLMLMGLGATAQAEVVNFKQLLPFVELKIAGWEMEGKPTGVTMKQGPVNMSEAKATYKAGERTLDIMVMDFFGKPVPFMELGHEIDLEGTEEKVRTITLQWFKGLEILRIKDRQGEINLNVADRFWVKAECDGLDDLQPLRNILEQMPLPKLAELAKGK